MPAYLVVNIDVQDHERYALYRAMVPATLALFGGRYLARGGQVFGTEGAPPKGRIVISEFPSFEQAKAWRYSDAYMKIVTVREREARSRQFIVEGVAP